MTLEVSPSRTLPYPSGYFLDAVASIFPALTPYNQAPGHYSCASEFAPDQDCLMYHGSLPAGMLAAGAVGLATLSPTSGPV